MRKINKRKTCLSCNECYSEKMLKSKTSEAFYCEDCGLEKQTSKTDYDMEWRNFSEKDGGCTHSPRAGLTSHVNMTTSGLITTLSRADAFIGRFIKRRIDPAGQSRERREIQALCDRLNLTVPRVIDRACNIVKEVMNTNLQKFSRLRMIHAAAVLYASRYEGGESSRTFRELAMATARPQKEIARCFKKIKEAISDAHKTTSEDIEHPIVSFAKNYAVYLNMPRRWIIFSALLAEKILPNRSGRNVFGDADRQWDGRSRASLAATIVYIVSRLPRCPSKVDIKTVALKSGVRVSTIMTCYRDMLPVVDKLFENAPEDIVSGTEIINTFLPELQSLKNHLTL